MSLQVVCKTDIADRDDLVETLKELLGDIISVVEGGVDVTGYYSKKRPEVIINIPGLIGTAGYAKGKGGNYELVYDSSDGRRLSKIVPKKKGSTVIDPVAQIYSKNRVVTKTASALRGKVVKNEQLSTGVIKIKIRVGY